MKIINHKSSLFVQQFPNFSVHKKIILDLISKIPSTKMSTEWENINNTDWELPKDYKREYLDYFYKHIRGLLDNITHYMGMTRYEITAGWYQQYYKNNFHNWHVHPNCHFTNVFFLELPDVKYKTQIYNSNGEIIKVDAKEGDVITFPAYLNHRSDIIETENRKTVISFNLNFLDTNYAKINDTINKL